MSRGHDIDPEPFAFWEGPAGVLLLHGFTGTPFEVRRLGEHLRQQGFSVLAPRLPGHGTRPEDLQPLAPADWRWAANEALEQLERRCARVAVGGLSLGALLALDLAARKPSRVRAAVLLASPYRLSGRLGFLLSMYRFTPLILVKPYFPKRDNPGELQDPVWRKRNPSYDRMPMRAALRLVPFMLQAPGLAERVRCPTLVVHGEKDNVVLSSGSRRLARRLRAAPVRELYLEHSGHLLTLDFEQDRLRDQVSAFLREVL